MGYLKNLNKIVTTSAAFAAIALACFPAHAGWQETFSDNFDGSSLDTSKWQMSDYWGMHANISDQQLQCYLDANVSVAGGVATLTAKQEFPPGCNPDPGILEYTSGMISTGGKFQQTYGYFEMRAKVPQGQGLWPEMSLRIPGGSFPPRPPEVGTGIYGQDPFSAQLRYETFDETTGVVSHNTSENIGVDLSADFHTYGIDWQPGLLIYYVDGVERSRYVGADVYANSLYIALQLAVGGLHSGNPDSNTVFPAGMQIDYVKAFQRVNDGNPDTLPPGSVAPPPADDVAPIVKITNLKGLARVKGDDKNFTMTASASDDVGVTEVEFLMDGQLVCTDTSVPYSCAMRTPKLAKKEALRIVTLTVRAKDAAGNVASDNLKILVVNDRD